MICERAVSTDTSKSVFSGNSVVHMSFYCFETNIKKCDLV